MSTTEEGREEAESEGASTEDPRDQGGIQVEMIVDGPEGCPVARVSRECATRVNSVARTTSLGNDCEVAEFTVPDEVEPPQSDIAPVFSTGSRTRYRLSREPEGHCLCRFLEQFECPISDIRADHGDLYVTFYAPDMETVQEIVSGTRSEFSSVRLRQLTHSGELSCEDPVVVDRGQLTERQREVLSTAHELGYFEHPKGANASEVAAELDIAPSTFSEHLAAAQSKLMAAVLDD